MRLVMMSAHRPASLSALRPLLRLAPYVLTVLALKLYAVSLLLSSGLLAPARETRQTTGRVRAIPERMPDVKTTARPDAGLEELSRVLAALNSTSLTPSAANRTRDTAWLFFNRIPRSGGKTLVALLHALGADLDYQHQEHTYRTPWQRLMTPEEQRNLAIWFEYNIWPKTYDRLALYINFTERHSPYIQTRPALLTLLRDPVQQFLSQFYHRREDLDTVGRTIALRERASPGDGRRWYWRKADDCILEGDPECALTEGGEDFERAVPFLCGQHQQCLKRGDPWALQRAKFMAEYEYSVVGVLEDWNSTLGVMEHYLPAFFQGARQRYWSDEMADERQVNKRRRHVPPVSARALLVLRAKLGTDYDLYEFCRQRLHRQWERVANRLDDTSPLPPVKGPKKELSAWDRFQIEMKY